MRALLSNGIGASHLTKKKALQALLADVDALYLVKQEPHAGAAATGMSGAAGKLGFSNFGLKF
jgi:hypothetical protein